MVKVYLKKDSSIYIKTRFTGLLRGETHVCPTCRHDVFLTTEKVFAFLSELSKKAVTLDDYDDTFAWDFDSEGLALAITFLEESGWLSIQDIKSMFGV